MDIFDSDGDRIFYLRLIKEHTDRCGVETLAWCLMTNHVLFVAIPQKEDSLAKAFGEAHRLRIPTHVGHPFRFMSATYSD
jgi:putative transposase